MRINIRHSTIYRYDHPVRFSAQYLRLTPYTNPSQRVLNWRIDAPGEQTPWTDGYGNLCHTLFCDEGFNEIHITAGGTVETTDTGGVLLHETGLPIGVFLRGTPLTRIDDSVRKFARPFHEEVGKNRLEALHGLAKKLADKVEYREDGTDVHSTAADVLKDGFGVCQDMAHLFIACARSLGVPARYVSGYLYTGEVDSPHVASHAWAAGWVDGLGWVSFDVANKICGTECHVGLAAALDYAGAQPVRGIRQGGGMDEMMEVQVQVSAAQA
jgi:transglutaminase-like putative cysteine protease